MYSYLTNVMKKKEKFLQCFRWKNFELKVKRIQSRMRFVFLMFNSVQSFGLLHFVIFVKKKKTKQKQERDTIIIIMISFKENIEY